MCGARKVTVAMLSAMAVVLSGCHANDTGKASLDDYVKKECAITVDFKDRLGRLTRDFATNVNDQTAMADTVQHIADLYDEVIAKDHELGDPPNGEGTSDSDEVERAARSLVDALHKVATDIRTAKTNEDVQAAIARMNDAIVKSTTTAAEWKKKHPTPEIDRLQKAYPGCSVQPE
jgi:methyl-accepting chemotaxis protein